MIAAKKLQNLQHALQALSELEIHDAHDLERLTIFAEELDELIEEGHTDLEPLCNYVISKITQYDEQYPLPDVSGESMLQFLMEQHGHKLKNLSDVAPMSVISDILNGKRKLNKNHIDKLSKKYHISPAVFF